MDEGQRVITIAHPELSSGDLENNNKKKIEFAWSVLIVKHYLFIILSDNSFVSYTFYAPPPKKWWGIMLYPLKF